MVSVSSAQAFYACSVRPLPPLSPEHGRRLVHPWGGRGPCCFLSTELGQMDGSLVLAGQGIRKQDCRQWKEDGDCCALRAFRHNMSMSPLYRWITGAAACRSPTDLLSKHQIIVGGTMILFLVFGRNICN